MKIRRLATWGGLIGAAAVFLAGCGGGTQPAASNQPALQKENTAVVALPPQVAINAFFPELPGTAYSVYNSQVNYLMYAPLVAVSKSDTVDWADSLAKSITPSNNDQTYTVQLKNWNWSNGQPVTAQDVVFTFNLMMQSCTLKNAAYVYGGCGFGGLAASGHAAWKSATAQGSNTVVFQLTQPANPVWFELNGLGQILPVPEATWDKYPNDWASELKYVNGLVNKPTSAEYKVVDGPFTFDKAVTNQYWEFLPNKAYGGHKATISALILQYEGSDASEFAALKKGTVNVGYLPSSMLGSKSQLASVDNFSTSYGFCFYYINPNFSKSALNVGGAFNDLAVRQALQYGIDEKSLIQILDGSPKYGQYLYTAVPPQPAAIVKAVFGTSNIPAPYPFDIAKGKATLEADGWKLDSQGVMEKNGVKLSFPLDYSSGSTETTNAVTLLQKDWAAEGIQITPRPVPFNQILSTDTESGQNASKWAMAWYGGWCYEPNYYPTGSGMWQYINGSDGFNDPNFTAVINKTYEPASPQQAQANMLAYANYMAQNLPVLWMPGGLGLNETAKYISGVSENWNPIVYINWPNYWTISH